MNGGMRMEKTKYDFIFSLGSSCGASQAVRAAGLQFASYPMDWVGVPDLMSGVRIVASRFEGWLEAEDLELLDVRHGPGFNTRIYRNRKTRIVFGHEFSDFKRFEESYPKVRETYDRRIARFFARAAAARRVLAVFLEVPVSPRASDEVLSEARRRLGEALGGTTVDLLYVCEDPDCAIPKVSRPSAGVTVLAADYRRFDRGEVTHFVNYDCLTRFLRDNYQVADVRNAGERDAFRSEAKMVSQLRWGPDKSAIRRWWNKQMYKLYRHLERILQRRDIIHREGPLRYWE